MELSSTPSKLPLPFASSGGKTAIPVASQIGITPGAASLTDGFPPLTRTPIEAGGVPPSGLDMNGILYELSNCVRWSNAGGQYQWDSAFATDPNTGGYPHGAFVLSTDAQGFWISTADNNTANPETATATPVWSPRGFEDVTTVPMASSNVTLTPLQAARPVIVITGVLTANLNLIFPVFIKEWSVINNATGAFSVTCKTASGSGVVINNGASQLIYGDGDNIVSMRVVPSNVTSASIQGAFKNLQASSTGTNAAVTVSIDEIVVEDSSNNYKALRNVALSINSAGSGANGLDSGSISASTWYSIWVINNGTTTAGLLSSSSTAPTMPSGYTYKARIGWIRTDGTANKYPLPFNQFGNRIAFAPGSGKNLTSFSQLTSGVVGTYGTTMAAVSTSNYAPPTARKVAVVLQQTSVSNGAINASSNSVTSAYTGTSPGYANLAALAGSVTVEIPFEIQGTIYVSAQSSTATYITGYEENF